MTTRLVIALLCCSAAATGQAAIVYSAPNSFDSRTSLEDTSGAWTWDVNPDEEEVATAQAKNWSITVNSPAGINPKILNITFTHGAVPGHPNEGTNTNGVTVQGTFPPPGGGDFFRFGAQHFPHGPHTDFLNWRVVRPGEPGFVNDPNKASIRAGAGHRGAPNTFQGASFFASFAPFKPGTLTIDASYPDGSFEQKYEVEFTEEDLGNAKPKLYGILPNSMTGQVPTDYRMRFDDPGRVSDTTLSFLSGVAGDFLEEELGLATDFFAGQAGFVAPSLLNDDHDLFVAVDLVQWLNSPLSSSEFYLGQTFAITNGSSDQLPGFLVSTSPITFTTGDGWTTNPDGRFNGEVHVVGTIDGHSVPEPSAVLLLALGGAVIVSLTTRHASNSTTWFPTNEKAL